MEGYPVAVLGSGIVGLSAAIELKTRKPNLPVLLLERGVLPSGASTRNAGFACFGSMTELLDDLSAQEEQVVWELVERRYRGLLRLREKLGDDRIGYEPLGGFELFRPEDAPAFQACLEILPNFNRTLRAITGMDQTFQLTDDKIESLGFKNVRHLILNKGEGQLHTGKMMRAFLDLAREKGVDILNGIQVKALYQDLDGVYAECVPGGRLFFKQVLLATNGMTRQLMPDLDIRPARNQVLITAPVPGLPFEGSFHYDKGYYYFRNVGERILLGGGRNLDPVGEGTDDFGTTPLIREALERLLRDVILPGRHVEIEQWWSGILGLGPNKKPVLERIAPHVVVAARLGGMGVAIGTLVGEEAAGLLLEHL